MTQTIELQGHTVVSPVSELIYPLEKYFPVDPLVWFLLSEHKKKMLVLEMSPQRAAKILKRVPDEELRDFLVQAATLSQKDFLLEWAERYLKSTDGDKGHRDTFHVGGCVCGASPVDPRAYCAQRP